MKKISIAKALKLKNQLAGEVAELKARLLQQNVRSSKQKFDYQNEKVLAALESKIKELVAVKALIAAANSSIYGKIFRLAELKGLVTLLTTMDTKTGVFHEGGHLGEPVAVRYRAQISKVEVDKIVARLKTEIQSLQDSLDEFNFTQSVSI